MPRIPDHLLERIKHDVSIVELVTRAGIELRRVGTNLVGRCNRHEDKTPSLMVSEEKNLFHCMGACQKGGSVIDFVMWQKGITFHPAARELAEEFFLEEARAIFDRDVAIHARRRREEIPCPLDEDVEGAELASQVVGYYHERGKQSRELLAFLERRRIADSELVERFRIGVADRTLGMTLTGKQRAKLQGLGFFRSETGHEHLAGSMTLPILGASGEVLNCYGRKLRNDLRPGTPDHLYLPRPLLGVLNREAFGASGEIVLCEAPIDALTAWAHGFRATTTTWGTEGFTDDLLACFASSKTERCLIAFDRDDAGDEGARRVAKKLSAVGVACYRVLFPKGMDLNDVAVKMHPADKTLALFFRSAEWMCGGNGRKSVDLGDLAHSAVVTPAANSPSAADASALLVGEISTVVTADIAAEEGISGDERAAEASETSPASPVIPFAQGDAHESTTNRSTEPMIPAQDGSSITSSAATRPLEVELKGQDEAIFRFGDRRYRVRGLARNTAFGVLKLNVLVTREDLSESALAGTPVAGLHADTFDLYLSRARALFEKQTAIELGVKEETVKRDLASMLRKLEELQEAAIQRALEPKLTRVVLSEKETAESLLLLKSPDLLDRIVSDLTRCGLVGEETNKLVSYVAAVSRLLPRPLALIIQSSSAAGKTSLMEAILSMLPEESKEKYTAVSGKSLFYFDEDVSLSHKVLAIVEEEGAEKATYPLKILQSEGELVMASTGKDPHDGKLATKIYHVKGPVMIVLATTAPELDPELENRCLRLSVDESREQTRRIHELQRASQSLEGLIAEKEREKIRALHRNAQRLLRPLHVINPYQRELTFIDDQTRTRRDHEKYLTLIASIALLHQHQRQVQRVAVGDEVLECIEVDLKDIEIANRLAGEVLGRTLDELQPQTRRFLKLLHEHVERLTEATGTLQCDFRFSRKDVRRWMGWTDFQVRVHIARLVELEYVLVHRGARGQSFVYELLWKGEGLDDRPFVLGLADVESLREGVSTTATSRGEEGHFEGSSSPHRAPIERPSSVSPEAASINTSAAFPLSAADSSENSRLGETLRTRSYPLRPFHRAPRLNLLHHPPGSLGARATRARSLVKTLAR